MPRGMFKSNGSRPAGVCNSVEALIDSGNLMEPSIWGQHILPTRRDRDRFRFHDIFKPFGQRFFAHPIGISVLAKRPHICLFYAAAIPLLEALRRSRPNFGDRLGEALR